jgi:pyridoxamine 5'-phosphate oxidase
MSSAPRDTRRLLRALPVLTGSAPEFDPVRCADDPMTTFLEWLAEALAAGVPEPHAMTLSTVGADGLPDARVLILKDVDADGWHFAVSAESKKGADLSANPAVALTFYWPMQVRQVRVRGTVVADPARLTQDDFLARSVSARALVVIGRQSQPLADRAELDDAMTIAMAKLEAEPDLVPAEWVSYGVRPDTVEFWQGDPDRRHQRVHYASRPSGGWERTTLWP